MQTPEGETVSLSDFVSKNKYTLIDFWASWCAPCRKELPNVKRCYEKYKNKGFEILGVSLDKENRRMSLSIKQLETNPWESISEKFKVGQKIKKLFDFFQLNYTSGRRRARRLSI